MYRSARGARWCCGLSQCTMIHLATLRLSVARRQNERSLLLASLSGTHTAYSRNGHFGSHSLTLEFCGTHPFFSSLLTNCWPTLALTLTSCYSNNVPVSSLVLKRLTHHTCLLAPHTTAAAMLALTHKSDLLLWRSCIRGPNLKSHSDHLGSFLHWLH